MELAVSEVVVPELPLFTSLVRDITLRRENAKRLPRGRRP